MTRVKSKVLVDLTPLQTPGGARGIGRYIRELAWGLAALPRGEFDDIELLALTSLNWSGRHTVTSDFAGFLESRGTDLLDPSDYYSWAYRQRLSLWLAAGRLGVQAVHITDPHGTPRFLGWAGAKRIVTCHDIVPTRFPEHYFGVRDGGATIGRYIERERYRTADLVLAVSDATRTDVCSLLGVPEKRVWRVYGGIHVESWAAEPRVDPGPVLVRYGLAERNYVLYVGGADWRKNIEGMLAAIARVNAMGLQLDLAWAGHLEGQKVEDVKSMVAEVGILGSFHYLGYVPDDELSILYRGAVAHLLVSRLEGFGLTVVEAMACGCPVVTTQAGSLAEVAGDAALSVDPEDPSAIAAALERLLREPGLRADLIARGRLRAPRFSRYELGRATAEAYRRFLLGDNRQRTSTQP